MCAHVLQLNAGETLLAARRSIVGFSDPLHEETGLFQRKKRHQKFQAKSDVIVHLGPPRPTWHMLTCDYDVTVKPSALMFATGQTHETREGVVCRGGVVGIAGPGEVTEHEVTGKLDVDATRLVAWTKRPKHAGRWRSFTEGTVFVSSSLDGEPLVVVHKHLVPVRSGLVSVAKRQLFRLAMLLSTFLLMFFALAFQRAHYDLTLFFGEVARLASDILTLVRRLSRAYGAASSEFYLRS